jgi:small subunit ribosomal protein S18|tara:strand:+ start:5706 stop:5927 length:222 start_codon:yes stop_codon:yes gene_type:complete
MVDNIADKNTKEIIDLEGITYKDTKTLTNFLSDQGKILPRRVTGLSSKEQKKVTKLIKTARVAALLPFVIGKG